MVEGDDAEVVIEFPSRIGQIPYVIDPFVKPPVNFRAMVLGPGCLPDHGQN